MKQFSDFLDSIDLAEVKAGASISLEDIPLTDKQKEVISGMCFGVVIDILSSYHEWLHSDRD